MQVKKIILGLMSLLFLFFLAIKTSGQWVSAFWKCPSQFQSSEIETWPAGLNFKIPSISGSSQTKQFKYIKTDSLGALAGQENKSPVKAWIFGSFKTANPSTPPLARWTSHLMIANRNFQIFDTHTLVSFVKKTLSISPESPQWIILGDFKINTAQQSLKFPDLSPIWIWNKRAISHPLYEWLCFYWMSPFCNNGITTPVGFDVSPGKLRELTEKQVEERLMKLFTDLSDLKIFLADTQIKPVALIFPISADEPKWKSFFNRRLRFRYSQLQIPFIDGEKCFENKKQDSLFMRSGLFSESGNREFAACIQDFLDKSSF